jgi:opacity protein-like surface antigen
LSIANALGAVSLVVLFCVQVAHAEPRAGGYLSLQGAAVLLMDADNDGDPFFPGSPEPSIESSYDLGYSVSAAVGYKFAGSILKGRVGPLYPRTELELVWREHKIDELEIDNDGGLGSFVGVGPLTGLSESASGEVRSASAIYNLWIDVDMPRVPVVPYFGGGIGVAGVWANEVTVRNVQIVDDSDTAFAYQLGAGVGVEVTEWLTLTIDYRWMGAAEPELETEADGRFDTEYDSHNLGMGLRYFF